MRIHHAVILLGILGACTPAIPDSGASVGFDDSPQARRAREAALTNGTTVTGDPLVPPAVLSSETVTATQPAAVTPAQAVSASSGAVATATGPDPSAEDIARQTAAALGLPPAPTSGAATGSGAYLRQDPPILARYALSTSNRVGERIHSRSGVDLEAEALRNCAKYPSPELAQLAFLAAGGPERDRYGLDPDGDGFACGWDPTPFRQAARN